MEVLNKCHLNIKVCSQFARKSKFRYFWSLLRRTRLPKICGRTFLFKQNISVASYMEHTVVMMIGAGISPKKSKDTFLCGTEVFLRQCYGKFPKALVKKLVCCCNRHLSLSLKNYQNWRISPGISWVMKCRSAGIIRHCWKLWEIAYCTIVPS